ncbi:hypothetical protein AB0I72_08800 [Nocardiopsis sp. NPDC049922]|uniref:hypothetical protein n=1 Tax=Nocardiopsis sp. NPDC049922 TaxID=3155157 RepID=UPI00340505A0
MTDTPQRRDPAPGNQVSAADFQASLNGAAAPATPPPAPTRGRAHPAPASATASDTSAREEGAAPPVRTDHLHSTVTPGAGADEPAVEAAMDRPSKPVLAGAAIAGLLLVVAPFAFSTGMQNGTWLTSIPLSAGGALGDGPAQGTAAEAADTVTGPSGVDGSAGASGETSGDSDSGSEQDSGGDPSADTGGAPGAEDPGYIPEALPQDTGSPALPETEGTERNDVPADTPASEAGDVASERAETTPERSDDAEGASGSDTEPDQDANGGTDTQDTPAAADTPDEAPADTDTESTTTEDEDTSDESEPAAEDTPNTLADQDTGTAEGDTTAPGADQGGGSLLEDTVESNGAASPEPFSAVTGPGCLASPGAAYDRVGRWDSAEGTSSWATRPGGYGQEGCDGGYEAIPVSGNADHGDGQYALWAFSPGYPNATCEIYVFVPDDESPLWVAETEATYQIYSGPRPEGDAIAVFGITQANVRGAWVQVTGFTSPTEEFTVQLTNVGENPLADQEHASSHVAASVVRATCS